MGSTMQAATRDTATRDTTTRDTTTRDMATQDTATRAPSDETTEKALGQVLRAIANDCPWAATDHIAAVLRDHYEATRDAKVQNFRLVLAERETRVQLRHEHAGSIPLAPDLKDDR